MSRIGNKPITIPEGVEVTLNDKNITVKGPKGTLSKEIHKNVDVKIEGNVITVSRIDDEPANRSLHGLTRSLINNMIVGVKDEFKRELEINGVGYRAQKQGTKLVMSLGYSHPVEIEAPAGITFDVPNQEIGIEAICHHGQEDDYESYYIPLFPEEEKMLMFKVIGALVQELTEE